MKQSFTIILFFSIAVSLYGQNNYVGIRGGLSLTNIFADNRTSGGLQPEAKTSYLAGLTFEHLFKRRFTLGVEILYNQKGFVSQLRYGTNPYKPVPTYFNYDYLTIPLKGGWMFGDRIIGIANIGICPSYLIHASVTGNSESSNQTDLVARFDLGGLIEAGIGYKIKSRWIIQTAAIYQQSFTSITTSKYFAGGNIKHFGIGISVGLKYAFGKD